MTEPSSPPPVPVAPVAPVPVEPAVAGSPAPAVRPPRRAAAFAGLAATGAAIATGELLAGLVPGIPSPILSVGRVVVDLQPPGAKELVVSIFGTADKLALEVLVLVVALAIGAGLGVLARARQGLAMGVLGVFVVIGIAAGLRDPGTQPTLAVLAGLGEYLVGATALDRLMRLVTGRATAASGATAAPAGGIAATPDWSRRTLLVRGGGLALASIAAGAIGRVLLDRQRVPATGSLPEPELPVGLPAGADLGLEGLTPIVVPNQDFYRIDTALLVPNVDRDSWRLRIHGLVEREVTLSYADLLELPVVEQYVTIACVSNRVGGDLIGNARWTGVRLRDVLDLAGVKDGATQLVGRSVDDWTAGMPVSWIMDPEREPMIAYGMNGDPLPRQHGFPARLIVPGLFGYVSATKWLSELELTTMEAFDGYWVPLGWSKEAPILTQSRIDRPRRGAEIESGTYSFAGMAWAPDRGIARVEVQVDEGEWREASLSTPISDATWLQWRIDWDATPGDHRVRVRATDGAGETQAEAETRPDPDGARGWHTVRFSVA
ncbi:MAG TPA: molybdopterin-dependent oxidoreductase [Candidatus Limnocylindrales bacterium]|nr:molybdopterin-dependent oxidoreductase [Candidatus Limnocylindrales bacterium]